MSINKVVQAFFRLFSWGKKRTKHRGTIKFFDRKKRFGFIVSNENEYFFHASATKSANIKQLRDGAAVYVATRTACAAAAAACCARRARGHGSRHR